MLSTSSWDIKLTFGVPLGTSKLSINLGFFLQSLEYKNKELFFTSVNTQISLSKIYF